MVIEVERKKEKGLENLYTYDHREPENKHLSFSINRAAQEIRFFPKENTVIRQFTLTGFKTLPGGFNEKGYIRGGVFYYLNKKCAEKGVSIVEVSNDKKTSIRKFRNTRKFILNYSDLKTLRRRLTTVVQEAKSEKSHLADELFSNILPTQFTYQGAGPKKRLTRVLANLDDSLISVLDKDHIDEIGRFYGNILKQKYSQRYKRIGLVRVAKVKIDTIALDDVIQKFEQLLEEDPIESKWGAFLKTNLFLLDPKYVDVMDELNLSLVTTRKVDFGLIDSHGYLDIYEIKRPSTKLLESKTNLGNYFWGKDAIKALVQAEKYLYAADQKSPVLTKDIKRETGLDVKVIRPRTFVIMGNSNQLRNDNMEEDFRVLRMSLKNIEVILYDELLARLRNQKIKSV